MNKKVSLGFHPTIYPDPDGHRDKLEDTNIAEVPTMEDRQVASAAASWLIEKYDLLSYRVASAVNNDQFLVCLRKEVRACTWTQLHKLAELFGLEYEDFINVKNLPPAYHLGIEDKVIEHNLIKK